MRAQNTLTNKPTSGTAIFSALTCAALVMTGANGATLSHVIIGGGSKPLEIMNTNEDPDGKADISVFDGSAGYRGIGGNPNSNTTGEPAPVSGTFGDGTLVDYRFFSSPADENTSLELQTYAQGSASRISTMFAATAGQVSGSQSLIQVWETTDPSGFSTSVDFTSSTMAGLGFSAQLGDPNVATIDISNMTSGTIYFIAGGFAGAEEFRLRMTGTGQSDLDANNGNPSWPRNNRVHLHQFDFDNADLLYDTIQFDFDHGDDDGSAARFGGVLLEGTVVPEPSTALLGAFGMISLLLRRRK